MKFEDELQRLETILTRLEDGELSLDDSLQEYEQGVQALRNCREMLDKAERRIQELTPPELGGGVKPFAGDAEATRDS